MQADAAEIDAQTAADAPPKPAGKARLLRLEDLDRRTAVFRQVTERIGQLEQDLGGSDQLSTAERALAKHGVIAAAMADDLACRWLAGELIDPGAFATISNAARRAFESIGLRRRPRDATPSLHEYLAGKAATANEEAA